MDVQYGLGWWGGHRHTLSPGGPGDSGLATRDIAYTPYAHESSTHIGHSWPHKCHSTHCRVLGSLAQTRNSSFGYQRSKVQAVCKVIISNTP